MADSIYKTIPEYIENVPATDEARKRMRELHALIKKLAPKAEERMSWQMPTFWLNGNLVHFAAAKNHLGLYPGASGVANFTNELAGYKTSKGAIQFPYSKPMPWPLIEKIVKFRIKENLGE